jgi:hypothetical protein
MVHVQLNGIMGRGMGASRKSATAFRLLCKTVSLLAQWNVLK